MGGEYDLMVSFKDFGDVHFALKSKWGHFLKYLFFTDFSDTLKKN